VVGFGRVDCCLTFSVIITFSRVSILEFYEKMNLSEQLLNMVKQYDMFKGSNMNLYFGLGLLFSLDF